MLASRRYRTTIRCIRHLSGGAHPRRIWVTPQAWIGRPPRSSLFVRSAGKLQTPKPRRQRSTNFGPRNAFKRESRTMVRNLIIYKLGTTSQEVEPLGNLDLVTSALNGAFIDLEWESPVTAALPVD